MKKNKKEKKKPSLWMAVIVGALFSFLLTAGLMGMFMEKNVRVAELNTKMTCWTLEQMCDAVFHNELVDGYCPVNEVDAYVHHFSCSWGDILVYSPTRSISLKDRYNFWQTDCHHIRVEALIK